MLRPYLVLSDHLGSTSTTANEDGSWNSTIQYTAFGEIRLTKNTTPTKYRYTGQLAQAELGLDYYIARFYDPLTGHFTQADSIIPEPGKAYAFDRYAYSNNNPIIYKDPSGHWVETALDIAFIAYDIYDIQTQGWNTETGLSLAADVAGVILPGVTGGGLAVKALMHTDDAIDAAKIIDKTVETGKIVNKAADAEKAVKTFTKNNFRKNLMELTGKTADDVVGKDAHHILPQKFIEDFSPNGIDINDPRFGSWVENGAHQSWSKKYNDEWSEFLDKKPKKSEMLEFAKKKAKEYDFEINFE